VAKFDTSGNLGLGVTPSAWATYKSLELNQYGYISSGGAGWMELMDNVYYNAGYKYKSNGYASHYLQQNSGHYWFTAPSGTAGTAITFTQAMTLTTGQSLQLGTTTFAPTAGIVLVGPGDSSSPRAIIGHASGTASGNAYAEFFYNGSGIGSITQSGTTAVLYNVTSDQRLKENIVDAPEFGSVIDSIKVRSYDWKADGNHQRAGFIAQELVTVAPEAVHQPEDPEQMMAVDYSKLVPMLVKELQSLRARVAQLEGK